MGTSGRRPRRDHTYELSGGGRKENASVSGKRLLRSVVDGVVCVSSVLSVQGLVISDW